MDNEIKKLELSNEIAFMECELSLKIDSYDIVIESQRDSFFVNAFKKLEETVEKVIDAIRNFVNSKVFKNKINALNDFARRNPEFGVRSIKIPDYKKLKKLNKETITKLIKSKFPDEELEKYKKALKAIFIGGGITVGINLCANVIKKSSEEQIKDMEELKLKLSHYQSMIDNNIRYAYTNMGDEKHVERANQNIEWAQERKERAIKEYQDSKKSVNRLKSFIRAMSNSIVDFNREIINSITNINE